MAITNKTTMVTTFEREEPLDAPCSTITFLRTNSSSSFGGTDMLHLASKRSAIRRVMVEVPRGPSEDRDGQAAQRGRKTEGHCKPVPLRQRADAERPQPDAGIE